VTSYLPFHACVLAKVSNISDLSSRLQLWEPACEYLWKHFLLADLLVLQFW